MARRQQMITVNLTVSFVPNPDPEKGIDLLARLVLKELLKEEEENKRLSDQAVV